MKKIILASLCSVLLWSCSVDEEEKDPNLLSEWKLIETFQSDGGNENTYQPSDRQEIVQFYVDSIVKSNVSWCSEHDINFADYSDEENLIFLGCEETPISLNYKIKGNLLFIYPNCTETCVLKYRRIDHLQN